MSDLKQNVDILKSQIDEKRRRLQRDVTCPYGPKEEQGRIFNIYAYE
jgi:hypothetical protein